MTCGQRPSWSGSWATGRCGVVSRYRQGLITAAYPADFRRVLDVGLDNSPAARDSLYGLNVSEPVLWRRLTHVNRIWVVTFPSAAPRHLSYRSSPVFCLRHAWQYPLNLDLFYQRCPVWPAR